MITVRPPDALFQIGTTTIYTYGVVLAIAILVAFLWAEYRTKQAGVDPAIGGEVLFWAVVGGLIGARLGFIIQDPGYYSSHLGEILGIRNGGLSFHGALIGGVIGGGVALRHWNVSDQFWTFADSASAPILLGAIIGRIGNWANQELYGYPTSTPWGIVIDAAHRLPGFEQFSSFHPTFAYEALLNLLGLGILLVIEGKRQKAKNKSSDQNSKLLTVSHLLFTQPGVSFLFMLAWYSLARGLTEIWRISDRLIGPLSLAQIISLVTLVIAIGIYYRQQRTSA